MNQKSTIHPWTAILLVALTVQCGPPPSPSDDEVLEESCMAFCSVAVPCSDDEYAVDWGFQDEPECTDYCIRFTDAKVELYERPLCTAIITDMWDCAASIDTCETFQSFEDEAFGLGAGHEHPCWDQLKTFIDTCN